MKIWLPGWLRAGLCAGWLALAPQVSNAQYSNEWINFSQSYYKIPVAVAGIYRLTYADLQAAGIPVGSLDPRRINLYHRGTEQAIFVQGQADAVFDPADFIEFYGQKNDGTLDADLYSPSSSQPHPFYNLYSDTTAYFLTWNPQPVPGKRMTSYSEANVSLVKDSYHSERKLDVYTVEYNGGHTLSGEIQRTIFDVGEGWTGQAICTVSGGCTGQIDYVVDNLLRPVFSGPGPELEVLLAGRGDMQHLAEIYAGVNGGSLRLLSSTSWTGFGTVKLNVPLQWSDVGSDGRLTVRLKLTPTGIRDLASISYVKVTFPQNFDMISAGSKAFNLAQNLGNKSYVEIQNPPAGARIWDVTDGDNPGMIVSVPVSGGIGAIVPGTSLFRSLFVSGVQLTAPMKRITFRQLAPSVPNYIIISHRLLMKPALGYPDPVRAYAEYRASTAGGTYDTLSIAIDQLYNQFNYGETSPRAIYKFMRFLVDGGNPQFLFLIGKGLEVTQGYFRKTSFLPTDLKDLVPSAGMPGADIAFTAGLNGTTYEAAVPTGRLTASTPTQVASYLNKIKETEALPFDNLWRKDLLHLSGGINAGEPAVFRSYVDGFKAIAEGYFLGGKTETISKQTLNVELISVKDEVNHGLNLITFYGHSGPGTIDIDIGYVSDPTMGYNNAGKYPGFLINGCNAGRFFDNRVTFGEDWILTANKGAKSFIAHSSFGFTNALKQYSDLFYSVAFGDSTFMRKGVGAIQKEVGRRYQAAYGTDILSDTQVQQMVLLGDPSVPLFGATKPDYEINSDATSVISLDGKPVTALSDSFAIQMKVRNFGRAVQTPLKIMVKRTLGDNSSVQYDSTFASVLYEDILRIVIHRKGDNEFGSNAFQVTIDPDFVFSELTRANNTASISFFIPLNGTRNLFPTRFSIVHNPTTTLTFQNTNLLSGTRTYRIEVDTAATFDSPYLNRKDINGKVLLKFPVTLLSDDSLVYYWRTKLKDPLPGESTDWSMSSFSFIDNGPEGWTQIKFPQLTEDDTVGIGFDPVSQHLNFIETVTAVDITTFGNTHPAPFTQVSFKVNGEEFNVSSQGQPCRNNTLNLVAFDRSSAAPYAGIPFSLFDPRSCGREPQLINSFTPAEMDLATNGITQWVQNIAPGDSVVLFSVGDAGFASWSITTKLQLDQLGIGVNQLNSLQPGEPFVIFGRKAGATGSAQVFRAIGSPPQTQQLDVNQTISGRFPKGILSSPVIGPAGSWIEFTSQVTGASVNDVFGLNVYGVDLSGNETLLKTQSASVEPISDIDASLYPYLRVSIKVRDSIDLTPVRLRRWQVTYTPLAEGMITYSGTGEKETVKEGQDWSIAYGFVNISDRTFADSLSVNFDVFNAGNATTDRQIIRIKPPLPGDTTHFDIPLNTRGKGGSNDVTAFVNPRVIPEGDFDNNILTLYNRLEVEADRQGPVLDVTVDGRHIVNGDVVSVSPEIVVHVVDQNPYLLKTDTTGVDVLLRLPCPDSDDCDFVRVEFSDPGVSWTPASTDSEFTMTYSPTSMVNGEYVLRVSAVDANGNSSGDPPYEVSFKITDAEAFTLKSIYPNPSPEIFYLQFIVEGNEPPDDFALDLYTSTGLPIQHYGREALEQLHVGTNEIAVLARNSAGDLLPTGIYLFRLTISVDGKRFNRSGRLMVVR